MAFSNPWSNIIPAGSDPANTADDELRKLRLDVDERMDTLVGDWSADPIVVLTGIRKTAHWRLGAFERVGATGFYEVEGILGGFMTPDALATTVRWGIPLVLPVGAILQKVEGRVYRDQAGSALDMIARKVTDVPADTSLAQDVSASVAGWHTLTVSGLAQTVAVDESYYANFTMTAAVTVNSVQLAQVHYEYDITSAFQGITG